MDKLLIMVVEDEAMLLKAIDAKLRTKDFEVISCISGHEALEKLKTATKLPVAIWLDYYLKDMNGLEFMGELKKNAAWENIPVVVVSNSADPDKVHQMLALGANKYLLKAEFRMEKIIEEIRSLV